MSIQQRKKDHVQLTTEGDVQYRQSTGFDDYHFRHNALPEVDFDAISTECRFLGRSFAFPLFISSMTGGYAQAGAVNAIIAEFCESYNLPFGVGSQRIMLEHPEEADSFSVVREKAPNAFIAANIGGAQLVGGLPTNKLNCLIDCIAADAIIVHLNPLQEMMQRGGDRSFKGVEAGIRCLASESPVPVIIKETGAGISGPVAKRLLAAGADVIDIAGAGGTSWSKVENSRPQGSPGNQAFNEWGIPTLDCLLEVQSLKKAHTFELIASGGIRSSFDIAKALCLGANFTASAQPIIQAIVKDGRDGLEQLYGQWHDQLRKILLLIGCQQLNDLHSKHLVRPG